MSNPAHSNPANGNNNEPSADNSLGQFKRVLLSQIRPSRKNTRKIIRQDMIDTRAASMAESGPDNPIIVRPLIPQELANDGVIYEIVDGELRYRAALKNGDTEINIQVQDLTPFQAFKKGISSNRQFKPSPFEDYLAIEELVNSETMKKQEIADLFEVDPSIVGRALRILAVLNQTSRDLILENFQKSSGDWEIAENTLLRLTDLVDPKAVEGALRVALDQHMTEPKAKGLVAHVKAGNPPETYTGHKGPKTTKTPKLTTADIAKAIELTRQATLEETRGDTATTHRDALKAFMESAMAGNPGSPQMASPDGDRSGILPPWEAQQPSHTHRLAASQQVKPGVSPRQLGTAEQLAWDAAAGISVISRIKTKIKKGERPSFWEALLLASHYIWRGLVWLNKNGLKLIGHLLKFAGRLTLDALKSMAKALGKTFYQVAKLVVIIVILGGMAWLAWDIYHHGPLHPVKMVASKLWPSPKETPVPTPAATFPNSPTAKTVGDTSGISSLSPNGDKSGTQPATTPMPTVVETVISTPTVTAAPKPSAQKKSKPAVTANVQPTASPQVTPVKKTDIGGDVLKQVAPAGVDAAKKLFGL